MIQKQEVQTLETKEINNIIKIIFQYLMILFKSSNKEIVINDAKIAEIINTINTSNSREIREDTQVKGDDEYRLIAQALLTENESFIDTYGINNSSNITEFGTKELYEQYKSTRDESILMKFAIDHVAYGLKHNFLSHDDICPNGFYLTDEYPLGEFKDLKEAQEAYDRWIDQAPGIDQYNI